MNVRFMVPMRADGGPRDRLWAWVRDYWTDRFPDWPIIEGHHNRGPFNRSAAINRAAEGDWDIGIIADADTVCFAGQLARAVEHVKASGQMTLPFDRWVVLNRHDSRRVMEGQLPVDKPVTVRGEAHFSSLVAVPRAHWDALGGMDDRFVGWGAEDDAFQAAYSALCGAIYRAEGDCHHLWHPPSPERNTNSPLYRANLALLRRYGSARKSAPRMRALLDERDQVTYVVTTDGRRDCITETIPALEEHVSGLPVGARIICDDSGDDRYLHWLKRTFKGWAVHGNGVRQGYAPAMQAARSYAIRAERPWVFWCEDDYRFDRPVDLSALAHVLTGNEHLAQMALRRNAVWPKEIEAGGVIERRPHEYEDHTDGHHRWIEHDRFWTANPHLTTRAYLLAHPWPDGTSSERVYGDTMTAAGYRSGYWGPKSDGPWITHLGHTRVGHGY